jgi:hypothetical protein
MPRLISDKYQKLNYNLHRDDAGYGGTREVEDFAPHVVAFARQHKLSTILDYGCGKGHLKQSLNKIAPDLKVAEYDPAIPGKTALPKPAEFVVALDVMEHIEPEFLGAVLDHIATVTTRCAFMRISLVPAKKVLADGRNAHLILESPEWWRDQLSKFFKILQSDIIMYDGKPYAVDMICSPGRTSG